MTIAGQTFTVNQAGVSCAFTLGTTNAPVPASGGTGNVSFTATASDCAWTANSNDGFITLTSATSGTGKWNDQLQRGAESQLAGAQWDNDNRRENVHGESGRRFVCVYTWVNQLAGLCKWWNRKRQLHSHGERLQVDGKQQRRFHHPHVCPKRYGEWNDQLQCGAEYKL